MEATRVISDASASAIALPSAGAVDAAAPNDDHTVKRKNTDTIAVGDGVCIALFFRGQSLTRSQSSSRDIAEPPVKKMHLSGDL